ncbi:class C sortase [Aedoeadaptatus pacaensis]|uniref:class C sortase n=1 Tax=Aedoeadaptatus pacaensis TaxID=1776390 RepID=UPI00083984BA|nr:class C sortase [Peptoniphilus pacaensis]
MAKKKQSNWFFKFIFVLGFLILMYPQVSRLYYRVQSTQEVASFEEGKAALSDEEIKKRMALARDFNDSLVNQNMEDPYSKARHERGRAAYAHMLEIHEQIGHIQIPTIDLDIPIRAGTSEEVLQTSAGHLEGTSLPIGGNSTHTVITAHSGLPTAKLFTDIRDLKEGDRFYIHNIAETLAYEVDQIKVVEPSNFEDLLVVPGHDYATLLTCTPIGINSHRLLVRGHRVPYDKAVDDQFVADNKKDFLYKYAFFAVIALILLLAYGSWNYRKKLKRLESDIRAFEKVMGAGDGKGAGDDKD